LDDGIAHTFVSTAMYSSLMAYSFLRPASLKIDPSEETAASALDTKVWPIP
jgi:hypothetical protein